MTYEEYLDDDTIEEHTEWVDGEVLPMMSVSRAHAELATFLTRLIGGYAEDHGIGSVFADPFQMKLPAGGPGRAPDIMLVRQENRGRILAKNLDGPADLVIEILSPGNERTDRTDKFREYEQGGVPEYWILDPVREIAQFFVRDDGGMYRAGAVDADGVFASPALDGFPLKVNWLWERPPVGPLLRTLGVS